MTTMTVDDWLSFGNAIQEDCDFTNDSFIRISLTLMHYKQERTCVPLSMAPDVQQCLNSNVQLAGMGTAY